jgi:hypothetical protein
MNHPDAHRAKQTPVPRIVAVAIALAAVLTVIVLAFSWPAVTSDPRDVPLAITGPAPAVAAVEQAVSTAQPGAIAFTEVADRDDAVRRIQAREVYGAIVLGAQPEVLTASAASTVTNQLLTGLRAQLQAQLSAQAQAQGAAPAQVKITDVVPLSTGDPRGVGLTAAMFPLLLGGMIGGIGISVAVIGALRRVLAVLLYSAGGGLLLAAVMQNWFGSLQGNWWGNAGAIALSIAAIAGPITGLVALVGRAGIAAGPVIFMLVANPMSGATLPPQFLPGQWGRVGQWFPPGASASLLRDLSYFPAASALFPWLVLGGWAVAGLMLSVAGHARRRPRSRAIELGGTPGGAESDEEAGLEGSTHAHVAPQLSTTD